MLCWARIPSSKIVGLLLRLRVFRLSVIRLDLAIVAVRTVAQRRAKISTTRILLIVVYNVGTVSSKVLGNA